MTNEPQSITTENGDAEGYITKEEVARRLRKTVRTIEHWMRVGALPYIKIGQSVLFSWPDVQAHLQSHFRVCRPRLEKQPVRPSCAKSEGTEGTQRTR